jgi:hypothetical protein
VMCSSVALLVRDDAVNDEGEIDTTGSAVMSRFSNQVAADCVIVAAAPGAAGCVIVAISTAAPGAAGCGAGVVAGFPLSSRGAGSRPRAFLAARRLSASEPPGD